jgi:ApbE superfamily uncharacterized protein (UPF0280 family)
MSGRARAVLLADGRRLHLQHGPIDIIAEAFGAPAERRLAYRQAAARFAGVLDELVAELDLLRRPLGALSPPLTGAIARRMAAAVWPYRGRYVTPMAAVAGAVAEAVLAAMTAGRRLARAYVNNGGDIALHLAPGERLAAGVVANADLPALAGSVVVTHAMPVRGIATSGWRGRSFSLGIADAVTVLAADAAAADAAATIIANAVDCDHPAIARAPASHLREDTDLGDLQVTVAVGALPVQAIERALTRGAGRAEACRRAGLIVAASLMLQGQVRTVGALATGAGGLKVAG